MENLTGGTPPVRYLLCVVPCKLYFMEEEKPNQKEKPAFRDERITKLIPKTVPKGQEADFVVKALEFYNRHLQRNKAHER